MKIKQTSRAVNISKRVRDVSSVATTVCKRRVQCYNSPTPKGSGGIRGEIEGGRADSDSERRLIRGFSLCFAEKAERNTSTIVTLCSTVGSRDRCARIRGIRNDCGGSDSVVVPVKVVADRVDCAPDVHFRHGSHHDTKLEVAPVTYLESTLLTFAHLILISCVHEIRINEAHEQRESGLQNETAETVRDEDATRVDTR